MKKFNVEGFGTVSRENAVFSTFLIEGSKEDLDAMEVGDERTFSFTSGAGHTVAKVERIQ